MDPDATIVGLDRFRPEDRPPVTVPFVSYRLMVGIGSYLIALSLAGCYFRLRGTLFEKRWMLRLLRRRTARMRAASSANAKGFAM